jgi:hypothetical protein
MKMAKIVITVDTDTDDISATIDGTAIESPSEVTIYKYEKEVYVSVVSVQGFDDNTNKLTRYCSAECEEAKEAMAAGVLVDRKKIPGMVIMPEKTKAQRDIESYFSNKLSIG